VRYAGDVKDRIVVRVRIEARVIAERSFAPPLAGIDVSLDDDLRL
jgi:hypothetical protein